MHRKTISPDGATQAFSDPPVRNFFNTCDPIEALCRRSHVDLHWATGLRDVIYEKYPEYLEGNEFDDEFLLMMGRRAIFRRDHPLGLVMSRESRDRMNRGRTQGYTVPGPKGPGQNTPPVRSRPDYDSARISAAMRNVPPPPPPARSARPARSSSTGPPPPPPIPHSLGTAPKSKGGGKAGRYEDKYLRR